jgi:hypothetical protein
MKAFYKNKKKLIDMDIVETEIYLQRKMNSGHNVDDYQNCYVYISKDGKFYIEQNDSWNWGGEQNLEHGILLDDLTNKDIDTLKARYGDDVFEKYKHKQE